jgi:peptidyl-prolyl cis-trans isomerase SurA
MKHFFVCLLATGLVSFGNIVYGQSYLIDKVIAKVGSEYILLSDVEEEFSYAKSKDPLRMRLKCSILDNMIAQKLVIYQAKLDSVEITDAEVDTQLDYQI